MKKLLALAAPPVSLAAAFSAELYRYVFCKKGSPLLSRLLDKKGHREDYYLHRDGSAQALRELPQRRFEIFSPRGETLRGFYIPCGGSGGKKLAFIVHGYRSEHAETAGMYIDYYASRGFDVFCCDNTAAGESGGRHIGFDVFESADCLRWLDFLRVRFGEDIQIILHGFSMGGATVLKMSAFCPDTVKFIVADSAYADARELLRGQLGPLFWPMRLLNRAIAGYDLSETRVRPSLENCSLPILFVHGRDDSAVPFANGPALRRIYQGPKDCLFAEGARHVETMHVAPAAYAQKLDAFTARYIRG